jgi:hypothetical protein
MDAASDCFYDGFGVRHSSTASLYFAVSGVFFGFAAV